MTHFTFDHTPEGPEVVVTDLPFSIVGDLNVTVKCYQTDTLEEHPVHVNFDGTHLMMGDVYKDRTGIEKIFSFQLGVYADRSVYLGSRYKEAGKFTFTIDY